MVFDLDLIKKVYERMPANIEAGRKLIGRPLTLADKILYNHLYTAPSVALNRGKDYVDFAPDRVAMQDATAQMALLADAEIPSGRIHQIRLVLGENNSVEWDGQTIPLQTPSAQQSGLKLNIQQDVTGGVLYTLLMDFDAGRSIVQSGNQSLILKPVIRTILQAAGGSIRGVIAPKDLHTAIFAIQGTDTIAGTFTDSTGGYLIRALNAGTYKVAAAPLEPGIESKSIDGVSVSDGNVTVVDTLSFQ